MAFLLEGQDQNEEATVRSDALFHLHFDYIASEFGSDPQKNLMRCLSEDSVSILDPSFEMIWDVQAVPLDRVKNLGEGSCGVAYEIIGLDLVLKQAVPNPLGSIFEDYTVGQRVWKKFEEARVYFRNNDLLPRTPKYFCFGGRVGNLASPPREDEDKVPRRQLDFLTEERVLPLAKPIRNALIDVFCPRGLSRETAKAVCYNQDIVARLLLGKPEHEEPNSANNPATFSLFNYPLYRERAMRICSKGDLERFAAQMGAALAVMHFSCRIDATGVKFVLGSASICEPRNGLIRPVHLWIIDFDKVIHMNLDESGIRQAIEAVEYNVPYLPKPVKFAHITYDLWISFARAYQRTAMDIIVWKQLENCTHLPSLFLKGWESCYEYNLPSIDILVMTP